MSKALHRHDYLQELLYEIIDTGHHSASPECTGDGQPLQHHTLLYMAKGDGQVEVNGQSSPLHKNVLLFYAPGTSVELRLNSSREAMLYWVCFDLFRLSRSSTQVREYRREDVFPIQGMFRRGSHEVYRLMHMLVTEDAGSKTADQPYARQQLLHDLLNLLLHKEDKTEDMDMTKRLRMTIDYMHGHYNEHIRMSKLAEWGQFHPAYYSQIFKQRMNKTPTAYLTHLRINKAKEMLLTTDKPVSQVAAQVGYGDEFYFSKRFKETSGYSPSTFPRKHHLNIVSLSAPYTDHLVTLGLTPSAAQLHPYLSLETQSLSIPEHAAEPWRTGRSIFLDIKPDLILCKDNVWDKAQEHINDIAPIISIAWKSKDVYRHLTDIAELVNKQEAAADWLDEHADHSERWRKKLRPVVGNATVALCVYQQEELRMYGARSFGHVFYRSLNLDPPQKIKSAMQNYPAGTGFAWQSLQPDELLAYEADILIVAVATTHDQGQVRQWMRTLPAWRLHPAVKKNRVYFVDWKQWIIYAPQVIHEQLQQAGRMLSSV